MQGTLTRLRLRQQHGFTMIELVIVIIVLGIMSAVAIPVIGSFISNSKETATKDEMRTLAKAIIGTDSPADRGFAGDVGFVPSALTDLATKPGSVAVWNGYQQVGWNGPYVDATDNEYLIDAWGQAYMFNSGARTITSVGGDDTLIINF